MQKLDITTVDNKSMIVIDTNVALFLFPQLVKEEYKDQKLVEELQKRQKLNQLYITQIIDAEFSLHNMDEQPSIVDEFWHMFSKTTLSNSFDHIGTINDICEEGVKKATDPWFAKKIENRKLKFKLDYDEAKLAYDEIYEKWQANKKEFGKELLRSKKSYVAKHRALTMAEKNQSYLFVEESDRIILSTIAYIVKENNVVVFVTNDSSILLLKDELKKLSINVIKGKMKNK